MIAILGIEFIGCIITITFIHSATKNERGLE